MFLNKTAQNPIVPTPDVVSVACSRFVGAWEGTVEPDIKAMTQSEEGELAAPFDPVGFAEIKNKVGGPVSAVQSDEV